MTYRYTPFTVLSAIIIVFSIVFIFKMLTSDFSWYFKLYLIFGITLFVIDYYFQQRKVNYFTIILVESLISLCHLSFALFHL